MSGAQYWTIVYQIIIYGAFMFVLYCEHCTCLSLLPYKYHVCNQHAQRRPPPYNKLKPDLCFLIKLLNWRSFWKDSGCALN